MKFKKSGFTLIELLVVIAIIGILAAVIIASLNDARQQGIDAKVKSEMDTLAKRAAIDESRSFTYNTVCGSNGITQSPIISGLIVSIESLASSTVACNSDTTEYAASVAVGTAYLCIDSLGTKKEIAAALNTAVGFEEFACP